MTIQLDRYLFRFLQLPSSFARAIRRQACRARKRRERIAFRLALAAALIAVLWLYCPHLPSESLFLQACLPAAAVTSHDRRRHNRRARQTQASQVSRGHGSYSRYSTDMQRDESIAGQQRKCRERAQVDGLEIDSSYEFFDEAVSGTKRERDGLNKMIAAAKEGKIKTLYLYSLSRLGRESVITLPLLKQLVYVHNVRVISVADGVDTERDNWELIAAIMSIVHERFIKDLADSVLRGQEGNVLARYSNGDYCFGYSSVPVPGTEQARTKKSKMSYIVDVDTMPWVVRIFHWYVVERRSLRWITRRLNQMNAPKDHRSSTKYWHHTYLPRLLTNPKYVGTWPWGERKNVRDPMTGAVHQEFRPEDECGKWTRDFPELRIIDDEMFARAVELIEANAQAKEIARGDKGKFAGSSSGNRKLHPRHLLSMLIHCGECHDSTFIVGGANSKYLFCPNYAKGVCSCKSQLRRDLAERMILDQVSNRILANPAWFQAVMQTFHAAWKQQEAQLPTELNAARTALADVDGKIRNLLDQAEGKTDVPELQQRIQERRQQKNGLEEQLALLEKARQNRAPEPTPQWVEKQFGHLAEVLKDGGPAAAHALRTLVGHRITVSEVREEGRKRHYLRGTFGIKAAAVAGAMISSATGAKNVTSSNNADGQAQDGWQEAIVIDFREADRCEALADEVKALFDQGLKFRAIAAELGCGRPLVNKAFRYWFTSRGLEAPDGRSLRKRLPGNRMAEERMDEIMDLWDGGMTYAQIADRLDCDRSIITEAVQKWFKARGLTAPDGRACRSERQRPK